MASKSTNQMCPFFIALLLICGPAPLAHSEEDQKNEVAESTTSPERKLEQERKPPAWSDAQAGLRMRLTADQQTFRPGESIPMKLEVENVSDHEQKYEGIVIPDNNSLRVVDDRGELVPYIGGLAQVQVRNEKVAPAEVKVAREFDLTDWFYLRKPGRYQVEWPEQPHVPTMEFEIAGENTLDDGDPVGRLLPLVKHRWWLDAGQKPKTLNPGGNRGETQGRMFGFLYNPTGYKVDSGIVWLWLTDEAAEQQQPADWPPPSDYLGAVDRWHVYIHVSENADQSWPTAAKEIKAALAQLPDATGQDEQSRD